MSDRPTPTQGHHRPDRLARHLLLPSTGGSHESRQLRHPPAGRISRRFSLTPKVAPLRVGGHVNPPVKLETVAPVYPKIAKDARVHGVVILECVISPRGTVTDVRVLRGVPLLDQAAIDAVRQWVYTPTLLNGIPVPVVMTVTVNFNLL